MSQRPSCREDFEIAIICALPLEYDAVALLFDEFWDKDGDTFGRAVGDFNTYTTGRIGKHDTVLALLSHMGKANAAAAAANMRSSYGALRLVILTGICGGVPYYNQGNMFLGDVVISNHAIQYDFGRNYPDSFMRKNTDEDNLRKHDKNILGLLAKFNTSNGQDKLYKRTAYFLKQLQAKAVKYQEKYRYPGTAEDKLFKPNYHHKHRNSVACICRNCHGKEGLVCNEALALSCNDLGCNEEYLVKRNRNKEQDKQDQVQEPAIHIGAVASGDAVMKSGEDRDRIAKEENVIAFEMEAAGVWEELPCIVVKGVCNYADCHKNKLWQHFAAATAASASRAILEQYIQTDRGRGRLVEALPKGHFLVPFGRNQTFIGRESILSRLLEKIWPGANKDDCQRTAIKGLGGVGKTQIALEAVYLLHNKYPDCSIFWVPAVDATSFENAYRNIGKQLKIKQIDQDKADIKRLIKTFLSDESIGYWLLVIDNADDIELLFGANGLKEYLPFSPKGSILFTTRNHEVAVRLDVLAGSIFSVAEMAQKEALSLLQEGLEENQTSNLKATKKLLNILTNLPLAIRQASAYMAIKSISTLDYLELCESEPKDMIDLLSKDFGDRHRYKEIQNPVATTWHISFSHIIQHDHLAAEYLKFMSLLAEKDIPKSLLPTATKIKAIDAIGTLQAYAFITQREGKDSFDMHRLVRLAMRNWLEIEEELEGSIVSATERLNQVFPFPDHNNMAAWTRYLPHCQSALEFGEYATSNMAGARLLANTARGYTLLGHYRVAELKYRHALQLYEKMLGKEDRGTLPIITNLAIVLQSAGKYNEAEHELRRALELGEKLRVEKKIRESREKYRETLDICKTVFPEDHPTTLSIMNNLGTVLVHLGKYDKAEHIQQKTFKLKQETLGEDHPSTISSMSNFAFVLYKLGRFKEAESMYQYILELKKRTGDEKHPDTLAVMNNFALVLARLGKLDAAEKMHREILQFRMEMLSENHPDTIDSMDNLAGLLSILGKHEESEKMHRRALDLSTKERGEEHTGTIDCLNNLALVLERQGKYEEAEQVHRRTVELKIKAKKRAGEVGWVGWMRLAQGMSAGMVGLVLAALAIRLNWLVKEGGDETTVDIG